MGGIRPSGLHVNKPVVFGLVAFLIGGVIIYKFMWAGSMGTFFSKDDKPPNKGALESSYSINNNNNNKQLINNLLEDKLEPEGQGHKPVVWNSSMPSMKDPPSLFEAVAATITRKSETLEFSVNGIKCSTYMETYSLKDKAPAISILFLHGASFSSQTWVDLKVLDIVASWGYKAVAVDLPGYGKNKTPLDNSLSKKSYLEALIASLDLKKPVIVSPSMSGSYSLPFLLEDPVKSNELATAFIPVAPTVTKLYESAFAKCQIPTLIVYGTKDTGLGLGGLPYLQLMPNSITAPVEGAGHACYLDTNTKTFVKYLYNFFSHLKLLA